jgi:hypothetical protein
MKLPRFLLAAAALLIVAPDASARIKRSRSSASSGVKPSLLTPFYSLVLGSSVEYQRDREQTEWGFPILIEYNFTGRLKLTIEPVFANIRARTPDGRSVSGWGDLETTLDYEFLSERRYRPAVSLEGAIRWPTADDPDLGEPGRDYTLGLIASKDLVLVELDFNALYTFTGNREQPDELEVSLAAEWHVNGYFDLIGEVVNVMPTRGRQHETEATVGVAWIVSRHLKLEQGIVFKERGQWELVSAWEWHFGGD